MKDLSAERVGDHVLLRWTTPTRTTDDLEIEGPITAEVCREMDSRPSGVPSARPTMCTPVQRHLVVPGPSSITDVLPAALQLEPVNLITYRIQLFNSKGHSAGQSPVPAYAAAGHAPEKVTSLQATASERGAILEWHSATPPESYTAQIVDLKRIDLSAASRTEKKTRSSVLPAQKKTKPSQPGREEPEEVHLRTADAVGGPDSEMAGTIDSTAMMGDTYTYNAQRVRSVSAGNRSLEMQSEPSEPVRLTMIDTFPPKIPSGLATISGAAEASSEPGAKSPATGSYVDLSWEPNGEADLAGYRVYRQFARPDGSPQGPLARLTALPITVPAYRDVAVRAGQGYIYSVTAVDAAGNESAPSAKALEVVP